MWAIQTRLMNAAKVGGGKYFQVGNQTDIANALG